MATVLDLERAYYISALGLPSNTTMTLQDLRLAFYTNPPSGGGSSPTYANIPAGSVIAVVKSGGVWPNRPTTRTDVVCQWIGQDPSPSVVTSPAVNGMYNGDMRVITP